MKAMNSPQIHAAQCGEVSNLIQMSQSEAGKTQRNSAPKGFRMTPESTQALGRSRH
jgi:hypothetical protein